MKIVVLDGHTLNPGDLSWDELKALGEVTVYERSRPGEVPGRIDGAEIVLTNKVKLDRDIIQAAGALKYIGVTATGYNIVDVEAAKAHGIVVTNVPAYSTESVAQLTFALLLELTLRVGHHDASVKNGDWSASPDFCYWHYPLIELHGKTMGIIGLGRIGRAVARVATGFGMHVMAVHKHPERDRMRGVEFVSLDTCFREADVVSLHVPLNDDNHQFVNTRLLALMKPSAYLLNVSRGALVHEHDLAHALNTGIIAGAGVDVLSTEPPAKDNPLLTARNCLITPHIAWATQASRQRLLKIVEENITNFLAGTPSNRI